MHSLSFLSAIYSTINLCTGPFFLKVISQNVIQCLFSSTITLQVFQGLKENEDKSRDLGKGEKSILQQIQEGCMRQQEVQGTRFCIQRSKISEKEKKRPTQGVQAQTESSVPRKTHGLFVLHMVTSLF